MQITRPGLIFGGVASVTAGGVLGSLAASHSGGEANVWIFMAFVTNLVVQLYVKHRQRRELKEDAEARRQELAAAEQEIRRSMRTRLTDLGRRLDRIVTDENESFQRRRAEDELSGGD
jgi:hypothetical protein